MRDDRADHHADGCADPERRLRVPLSSRTRDERNMLRGEPSGLSGDDGECALVYRIHEENREAGDERVVTHGIHGDSLLPLAHPLVPLRGELDRAVPDVRDLEPVRRFLRARTQRRARECESEDPCMSGETRDHKWKIRFTSDVRSLNVTIENRRRMAASPL